MSKENVKKKLEIARLNAWFGEKQALHNVNMFVQENHVTALIGPSGCGKSTLIRCLNRMHETVPGARVQGEVLLDGKDMYGPKMDPVMVRREVGMVFQKPTPFPTMSIFHNVAAGLRLNGVTSRDHVEEKVISSLKQAALWDEVKDGLHKPGVSLSGGQQQRLCIARALAVQPEVLLLDEPCSALDPIATSRIEELLIQLKSEFTIVIVTHNMQQAARISEFTGFMLLGKLIEFGETGKLFTNPEKQETQDYITGRFG